MPRRAGAGCGCARHGGYGRAPVTLRRRGGSAEDAVEERLQCRILLLVRIRVVPVEALRLLDLRRQDVDGDLVRGDEVLVARGEPADEGDELGVVEEVVVALPDRLGGAALGVLEVPRHVALADGAAGD